MAEFLKKLGYEELRSTDHYGESVELKPGDRDGPIFGIPTVSGEEVPGINHIAFAVEDIDAVSEQL